MSFIRETMNSDISDRDIFGYPLMNALYDRARRVGYPTEYLAAAFRLGIEYADTRTEWLEDVKAHLMQAERDESVEVGG